MGKFYVDIAFLIGSFTIFMINIQRCHMLDFLFFNKQELSTLSNKKSFVFESQLYIFSR